VIDSRWVGGPRDGAQLPLEQPYSLYLLPIDADPSDSIPVIRRRGHQRPYMPVHVYRLTSVDPDHLHTYTYEGQRSV
jgi:hypothetical protein